MQGVWRRIDVSASEHTADVIARTCTHTPGGAPHSGGQTRVQEMNEWTDGVMDVRLKFAIGGSRAA
eukprot:509929-Rhodomonas_salina.1